MDHMTTACVPVPGQGNLWQARTPFGRVRLTPYGSNLIHFACFPGEPSALPMWGITGKPDPAVAVRCTETDREVRLSCPEIEAVLNRQDGSWTFCDGSGAPLVTLLRYEMEPAQVLGEQTFHLRLTFSAEEGEAFYGLGQHQDGRLNLAGREQILWHDYSHAGGEIVAVPLLVSGKKYAILMDNPSRSRVTPGTDGRTVWESEVGDAISFFLFCSPDSDGLYRTLRQLTGETPLPPRRGLGFIQCKQRYASRDELMEVAETYHAKGYPLDILVVDWFHWKVLGDMQVNPEFWPDPAEMNRRIRELGYETMISCWPRFKKESVYYDFLEEKGWFMKDAEGHTVYGTPQDRRGALIDTTNPECGAWYFDVIRRNYADKGFSYWWTDENEPDISPHESFLHAGTGARVHNLYPLTHSKCIYEGHRRALDHRCLILSRAAWTGAQKYGTTFWSSDIYPEWDVLRRQIPTALNFCASGMPYWSSDIGGWQDLPDEQSEEDYSSLLIATEHAGDSTVTKKNYAELYLRWFQFGVFCPTFRTHGTRRHNELWSYGPEAEQILARYLNLRYRLMPYVYSLAARTTRTGAPLMRALWMDFDDPACAGLEDEFLFGPAMLIAPVVEQGAVSRSVYLPAGCRWYDFYTNEVLEGGQTICADAPIDRIPIYIRAGSILPMGEPVPNLAHSQKEIEVRIYPGADASFCFYADDGCTYGYESGRYLAQQLIWDDSARQLRTERLHSGYDLPGLRFTPRIQEPTI